MSRGSERKAVESLVTRMYRHKLKTTGRLPDGKEVRKMEKEARESGHRVDTKRERK